MTDQTILTTRERRRLESQAQATLAYMEHHAATLELLERITTAVASHDVPGAEPDAIGWGHVGSIEHWRNGLQEIADQMFHEGEHAETAEAR